MICFGVKRKYVIEGKLLIQYSMQIKAFLPHRNACGGESCKKPKTAQSNFSHEFVLF